MKQLVLVGALLVAMGAVNASAQKTSPESVLGTVNVTKGVLADGKPLPPGTYQVRLTSDEPKLAVGESPNSERYVEFVRGGKVVGREVATVISAGDIGKIAKGRPPKPNTAVFQMLKGGTYWRVWINHAGTNYIINMPPAV